MPDTPQRHHNNIKTSKKKPKKHHFAMFKNNPLFFINFLFCSTYIFCFWKAVFLWKHYKHSVFSKAQLFKNTVSKPHFFTHVKKHLFPKKGVIFGFGLFPLKPLFYSFSWFELFWAQNIFWPKQIVCTKTRVFSPFLTQIVSGNFWKIHFLFFTFLHDHLKNLFS